MNNTVKILCIPKTKFSKSKVRQFVKYTGYIVIQALDNIQYLKAPIIEVPFSKTKCSIIIEVNNEYYYSDTFELYYKNLFLEDRIDIINYIQKTIEKDFFIEIKMKNFYSKIGDWKTIIIIKD